MRPLILAANDDIGRLDIAMHDGRRLLRKVLEYIKDLRSINQDVALLHRLVEPVHALFQVLAIHVLLHHKVAPALFKVVGNVWNEWMVKVGKGNHFLFEVAFVFLEPGRVVVIGYQFLNNNLLVIQAIIAGEQSRAHTTFTQHFFDDVAPALQGSTHRQSARIHCAHSSAATGITGRGRRIAGRGGRIADVSAAVAAITDAITIFSFTIWTFHSLPTFFDLGTGLRSLRYLSSCAYSSDYTVFLVSRRERIF